MITNRGEFKTLSPTRQLDFKVNNRNIRARCEIYSKLTIKTPEQRHWRRSGVFIVNCEHISHFFLVLLLLNLSRQMPARQTSNMKCPAKLVKGF